MDKKYDFQAAERHAQELWHKEKIYQLENKKENIYSIDTPPPTVSGSLHIGHIFSYTQTDILARYQRMNNRAVFYPFGFDDNGLPTERYVEKKRNIQSHTMSRSDFIAVCLQETASAEEQFKQLWQRMGLSVDWNACYSTISPEVRKISQESFIRLYKKKFIYRKYEPALYCTVCRTSVAQAELDDAEKSSFFNTIVFKKEDGGELLIGTTRPELLSSCVALFYNPEDARYKDLKNKKAFVPYFNYEIPILEDELVDPQKGTGLVMCCTFGDKTDIIWYKKHKLPYKISIGLDGKWTEQTGPLSGLKVMQAREKMIELLKQHDLLKHQRPIVHSVNIHERCKHEIEYIALSQWFLNIIDHKKTLIDLAEQISWNPEFMKSRYINWVENINWDWCLSRQRFFGIPFPVWRCTDCGEIMVADIKDLPIDPQETPYKGSCRKCSGTTIIPDKDVMDTWNTSSLTPYICYSLYQPGTESVFENEKLTSFIPMSMRPQAHDIIRTWAFYTIVKTWMHHAVIPWKSIVISGHVLSDSKEKISKSKENAKTDPEALLKIYPADIIRYWTASGSLGHDVSFSDKQLSIGQRLLTKLWNAFLFIKEHTHEVQWQPIENVQGIANEWILHQASACFKTYSQYLDRYEFNLALDAIERFFWNAFCDNYLELIKDSLFKPENYKKEQVDSTRLTLWHIGLRILQWYAPYLPHVTETLYQELYKQKINNSSLHKTRFDNIQILYSFDRSNNVMQQINNIIAQVRKLKSEHQLSLKANIDSLKVYSSNQELANSLTDYESLLKGVTHAQTVKYLTGDLENSILYKSDDGTVIVQIKI